MALLRSRIVKQDVLHRFKPFLAKLGVRSLATKSSSHADGTESPKKPRRFLKFSLITLLALIVVSIKDYQQTADVDDMDLVRPSSIPLYLYSRLPLNTISRIWGQFNNITLPTALRPAGFRLYSAIFGVKLDEMLDPDLTHYKNLAEFFYRKIRPETRPIDPTAVINSPSDGRILKFGRVELDGEIEQVKGMTYKISALLGSTDSSRLAAPASGIEYLNPHTDDMDMTFLGHLQNNTNEDVTARVSDNKQSSLVKFSKEGEKSHLHPSTSQVWEASQALAPTLEKKDLFYAVIYLAPGDYHRFHSPVTWVSTLRRHFVGELYSVAPYFQKAFNNLFVLNERVALLGYWKYGFFSMTAVGATNVGSIKINFDEDLVTNTSIYNGKKTKKNTCYEASYEGASKLLNGQPLLKGQEVGGFMLGSTVVLVFEAPETFQFTIENGQYVKMGEKIGELEDN